MVTTASVRPLGFLLVDKPKGVVSFQVVKYLRKILKMKRIGFAGTLDPLASGLMIVAVGEATKILNALEKMDKVYDVKIQFGATSETYDAEGPILPYEHAHEPSRAEIEKVLSEDFSGERLQIPPAYSAVKIGGKHAYDLVRGGHEVRIPAKKVIFYNIKILSYNYPVLECSVHCGSGTYIRTFAHDLGQKLQCGGYVQELRRTKIASHLIEDAVPLNDLHTQNYQDFLRTPQEFLTDWQRLEINGDDYKNLCLGSYVLNRFQLEAPLALAIFENKTVGLLEPCVGGKLVKFAKKFNLS